jgi:hypothetical protein
MKNKLFRKMISLLLLMALLALTGCSNHTEAVITTDGEEITEPVKVYETLSESLQKKFSYQDLTIGKLSYLMTEQQVISALGTPATVYNSSEKDKTEKVIDEKVYSYNELTLIFTNIKGEYLLTAAASVSDKDVFARGIKVGDSFKNILDSFYRDIDCMNHYIYSEDKSTVLGKYLYGNFTMDQLENVKTPDSVEYGMINFNGYDSMETAESYIVEFTCFNPPYKSGIASINDNFAQLAFDIDNNGIITAIRWYYYPEEG